MAYKKVRAADIESTDQYIPDLLNKQSIAHNISSNIDSFINDSRERLKGDVYDAIRANLQVYQLTFDALSRLCEVFADNMRKANQDFLDYVGRCEDEDPVNATHIPKYKDEIKEKEKKKDELKKISPTKTVQEGTNEDGSPKYETVPNEPEYSNAQAEIAKLEGEIAKLEKIIKYLEELDGEDSKACQTIENVETEISKFTTTVGGLEVSSIPNL